MRPRTCTCTFIHLRRLRAYLSSDNVYCTTHADQRSYVTLRRTNERERALSLTHIPVHTADRKHAGAHAHIPDTHRILTRMRAFYTTTPSPTR